MIDFGLPDINTVNENNQRYYLTEAGKFPSVTTVLGIAAKEGIDKWVKRIGVEKAEFLKQRAADRGNIIHQMMEDYVAGKEVIAPSPFHRSMFNELRKHLDEHMVEPWCQEIPLYSTKFKVAGRTDLIAVFDEPEIVDFKGASKPKKEAYIQGYRQQCCAYAAMFRERTGIHIKKYRILIVDEYANLQVFRGHTDDKIADFARLRMEFKARYGV